MDKHTIASLSSIVCAAGIAWSLPSSGMAQSTASSPQPAATSSNPEGTVAFSGGGVAAGIGFVWGDGKLVFQGKQHNFEVHGLSVLDAGAAGLTATGTVQNLHRLEDFSGNHAAASAGTIVAGGCGVAYLKNPSGVIILLDSTT